MKHGMAASNKEGSCFVVGALCLCISCIQDQWSPEDIATTPLHVHGILNLCCQGVLGVTGSPMSSDDGRAYKKRPKEETLPKC